jgi:hypothetical protein
MAGTRKILPAAIMKKLIFVILSLAVFVFPLALSSCTAEGSSLSEWKEKDVSSIDVVLIADEKTVSITDRAVIKQLIGDFRKVKLSKQTTAVFGTYPAPERWDYTVTVRAKTGESSEFYLNTYEKSGTTYTPLPRTVFKRASSRSTAYTGELKENTFNNLMWQIH